MSHPDSYQLLIRQLAEMRMEGEDNGDGERFEMENAEDSWDTLAEMIESARSILGLPAVLYPLDENE